LKSLCEERWADLEAVQGWETGRLARLLELASRDAERTEVGERRYLEALGLIRGGARLEELWEHLIEHAAADGALDDADERVLEHYLRFGTLATRIRRALGGILPGRADFVRVYRQLCDALADGRPFS